MQEKGILDEYHSPSFKIILIYHFLFDLMNYIYEQINAVKGNRMIVDV